MNGSKLALELDSRVTIVLPRRVYALCQFIEQFHQGHPQLFKSVGSGAKRHVILQSLESESLMHGFSADDVLEVGSILLDTLQSAQLSIVPSALHPCLKSALALNQYNTMGKLIAGTTLAQPSVRTIKLLR